MINLSSFEAVHYRGIDGLSLPKLSRVNLITGANGVGKTALIEAIWLFMGRYDASLLWDPKVQRSTNPIENPVSALSDKSLILRGTDRKGHCKWKVTFEKAVEVTGEPVVVTYAGDLKQYPLVGRLRTWINDEEHVSELPYRRNTPQGLVAYTRIDSAFMPPCIIEGTRWQLEMSAEDLKLYSDMVREGRKDDVTNALNFILPTIGDVQILTDETGESYLSATTDNGTQLPLNDLGGGVVRLLRLYLSFFAICRGIVLNDDSDVCRGMVLIDEIENGIHYSALHTLWDRVRIWMREWHVQFVATTHSAECIEAAMEAFADEPDELAIHKLYTENESGQIKAATFTGEALEGARNLNLEVR